MTEQINRVYIAGKVWEGLETEGGKDFEEIGNLIEKEEEYKLFFKSLAICNDCSAFPNEDGNISYRAEDENDEMTTIFAQRCGVSLFQYDWSKGLKTVDFEKSGEREIWVVFGVCKNEKMLTYVAQQADVNGYEKGGVHAITKAWGTDTLDILLKGFKEGSQSMEHPAEYVSVSHKILSEEEFLKVKKVGEEVDGDDASSRMKNIKKVYSQEVEKDMKLLGCLEIQSVPIKKKRGKTGGVKAMVIIFLMIFLFVIFVVVAFLVFGRMIGKSNNNDVEENRTEL